MANVRSRVDGDLSSVQAEAQTRADNVVAGAKDALQSAGEKVELEERMRDNPYPILPPVLAPAPSLVSSPAVGAATKSMAATAATLPVCCRPSSAP